MPLSDTAIKNAKPTEKPYKMPDEKGMYVLVNPNGGKYFRLDYPHLYADIFQQLPNPNLWQSYCAILMPMAAISSLEQHYNSNR